MRILKIILYIILADLVFVFGTDVYSVPDYRGHKAYVEYSEDKQYKGIIIIPNENDKWWNAVVMLVRASDNQVLAYERATRDSTFEGPRGFSDYCANEVNAPYDPCYQAMSWMDPIKMPPSLWKRVNAWLTVKIRGFENPNLKEEPY